MHDIYDGLKKGPTIEQMRKLNPGLDDLLNKIKPVKLSDIDPLGAKNTEQQAQADSSQDNTMSDDSFDDAYLNRMGG